MSVFEALASMGAALRRAGLPAILALAMAAAPVAAQSPLAGTWLTGVGAHVTISPCAEGLCGVISRVAVPPEIYARFKDEIDRIGEQNVPDYLNRDPSLRTRPLLGLRVLTLPPAAGGGGGDVEGRIYNAEDGNTYSGSLRVLGPDRLRLTGCSLVIFCRSEDWTRVR